MDKTESLDIRWVQGCINTNIVFVDEKTVCYGCGNHICFLDLETEARSVFQSPGRGVGALTAAGRGSFAFSEQKLSPSIFVYIFPELQLKNELKGIAQLDYTALTFSDEGPYLGSCSSLPDYTITVWNWETAEAICTQSQAGQDVVSLVFNPLNWLQLCALGTTTLTVWNIEKSDSFHVLKPRVIQLPAADGSFAERHFDTALIDNKMPDTTLHSTRTTLTPSAVCWTATSKLYVGCAEGYLFLVDPESFSVSVVFSPTTAIPELQNLSFQAFTLTENGLIAVGKESVLHCVKITESQTNITQTWPLERPVTNITLSPDNETLLLSASTGQIYLLNPSKSDKILKILDVLSGNFLSASFLQTDRNICVSLRDSGVLELWSSDGSCLGFLHLQAKVTSLACCPVAHYAAVGTESGRVLFVDLNKEEQPRLVHQLYLYHSAVDHLVFDQEGHYLLACSGSDPHVYVINAKPSARFSVLGYILVSGCILSVSTQCPSDDEVKVLVVCTEQKGKHEDFSLLIMVSLHGRNLAGPDCADRHGGLSPHVLRLSKYKVPRPLSSCALGVGEVFAYCQRKKSLQRFQLPGETEGVTSQEVVQLEPVQEVKGHPLGPASVLLSPHCLWFASTGRDGLLRIRQTDSIEQYIELPCHSCRLGGSRSVSFSSDGLTLLTTGFNDASLVCTNLRIKGVGEEKRNNAVQFSHFRVQALKKALDSENPVLVNFRVWDEGSTKGEDREVRVQTSLEEERLGITPSAPRSDLTWLENKREEVVKEDNEQYSEEKERLRETVREIRNTLQKMLRENDSLPVEQFNLDVEEQRRLEDMAEQEAERVRAETKQSIIERYYLRDVMKRECWDSWMVKSRAVKAFHSELIVQNYPLKERTQSELEDLRRVQNIRKLEEAACTLSGGEKNSSAGEPKQEEEGRGAGSAALTGSFSARFESSSPYVYDQFSLKSTEQRINQAILLQDVIYGIKMAFNAEFEAQHRQKLQELKRVGTRNRQIREIMQELETEQELWEPGLADSEWPERLVTVDDSEIKAEKYLTPEQKEEEERRKLKEETSLAAQGDDSRDRALDDMMDGVLEVKKVDILKMEIPPPEFVLTKPNNFWSEEEKKVYKEYEKKTSDLNEEKDIYRRSLESEMKKLQESNQEATIKFDQMLAKLLEKKLECTEALYREELNIIYLAESVLTEEEIRNSELELKLKLEKLLEYKQEISEDVVRHEHEVELVREAYENLVAKDTILDKEFRKQFPDVPRQTVEKLYKQFKHRPRVQKMRAQTENTSNLKLKEQRLHSSLVPDALSQMLKGTEELDSVKSMPEGVSLDIWDKFCLLHKAKVESEQQVELKALTLAEMQAFLRRRKNEVNAAQQEITDCSEALQRLHKKRNNLLINTRIQIVLKQGQVEVSTPDLTAGNTDTDFLLCHKSRVDDLREQIRKLMEKKIALMEKGKDVHKNIIQLEWKNTVLSNKIQDLKDKEKNIKKLQLPKQLQDMKFCSEKEQAQRMLNQISSLEKSIDLMKKCHQKKVQQCQKRIKQIKQQAAQKRRSTETLEQELPGLQVTVAELTNICGLAAAKENVAAEREERYQEILERRKWKELAISQAEELRLLSEEAERLRRRNFISLDKLKHD